MASPEQSILAFDVYGTLLSTASIAKQLSEHFGPEKAATIAAEWRKYQLEYTWRLNSMDKYEPFSSVTRKSLQHAVAEAGETLNDQSIDSLMSAYDTLRIFPDVAPVFKHLEDNQDVYPVVFSNGTATMINTSLTQSPDLSPHAKLFQKVVVVEPVKHFKPHPQVYSHLCEEVGKSGSGQEKDVWLVSGNPFDVVGANAMGMRTCWVDRGRNGWVDRLGDEDAGSPTVIVHGLDEVVPAVQKYVRR